MTAHLNAFEIQAARCIEVPVFSYGLDRKITLLDLQNESNRIERLYLDGNQLIEARDWELLNRCERVGDTSIRCEIIRGVLERALDNPELLRTSIQNLIRGDLSDELELGWVQPEDVESLEEISRGVLPETQSNELYLAPRATTALSRFLLIDVIRAVVRKRIQAYMEVGVTQSDNS